jgi:D-alanyl-D-alanine carboxypeptidase
MITKELLNQVLNKMGNNKRIFSAVVCVENGDKSLSWTGATGNMQKGSRYFIASVTKLYITAVIMRLVEEKRIALSDKISKYLPAHLCEGIHVLKGVDYSSELTVLHLISNTSGLPDYFFHKQTSGRTVSDELMEGNDEPWDLDRTIGLVKNLKPRFKPGAKGKAAYSDSNYQLLGRIIENITGKTVGDVFHEHIFSELNLQNTYAYNNIDDDTPVPFYYQSIQMWLPKYMTSITSEGGIVSTADEVMVFLKEFFKGRFFPKERINELKQWNLILPPPGLFFFGIGLEKLWTPRIASPFKPIKEILGFWVSSQKFGGESLSAPRATEVEFTSALCH